MAESEVIKTKEEDAALEDDDEEEKVVEEVKVSAPDLGEQLEPSLYGIKPVLKDKFNLSAVREIVLSVLHEILDGQVYSTQYAKTATQTLATEISKSVRAMKQSRYKHIVQVLIGEQKGAGIKSAMRSLWDLECDTYVSEQYKNSSLFCVVVVFGIYFY